ncbi:MAG: hypothetical protein QOJ91_983 [Sphingomonadales bacterium]|jgi:uncharacterized membrane protein YhaH (DUF805 family)|nr:hypothetical protein [Sphingomonadales bacterium]
MDWALAPLRKYADFKGRARRKEYWSFMVLVAVLFGAAYAIESLLDLRGARGYGPLTTLFQLAVLLPTLAVGARRLHDIGRSGWWLLAGYGASAASTALALAGVARWEYLLSLAAGIGFLVLLVFSVMEGIRGPNRFGEDPKAGEAFEPGAG